MTDEQPTNKGTEDNDAMDIDDMDVNIPLQEIRNMFEKQKAEIQRLKEQIKKLEDDYFEAATERDSALEQLKLFEPPFE